MRYTGSAKRSRRPSVAAADVEVLASALAGPSDLYAAIAELEALVKKAMLLVDEILASL